jgi:LysM repeat protein
MGQSTEELSTQIAGTRESLASDLDALQDRVSPSAIVERRKEAARGKVRSVKEKIMGSSPSAANSGSSTASDAATGVKGSAVDVKDAAGGAIEGSPLAAGLVAFGAGLVIAALIPATDPEQRASQKVVDAAQPLVEEAKSVGQEVGDNLKESATETAQQVKTSAQDSAQRVQAEGKSSVENVKSEAPRQS